MLYKATVMRELNVSLALVAAGAVPAARGDELLLARLAAVPCDTVPVSKLLLNADTLLAEVRPSKRKGLHGLGCRLLSGINYGWMD